MSAMVAEAVDLLQKADDYDIKFVIEYLKQDNNDIDTKKAALNRLVSMRKNQNLISNDYKEEYHNYLDERYSA